MRDADIPRLGESFWKTARLTMPEPKDRLTIRVDHDVVICEIADTTLLPSLRDLLAFFSAYPGLTSWALLCRSFGA